MGNVVYCATSMDGYIAAPDGGVDWLNSIPNPEGSDYGFADFMAGVDALLMGRKTFEQVLTFGAWPYDKPVFVLSSTLADVPAELKDKASVVRGDPPTALRRLNEEGFASVYVDGGRVVQACLAADAVDEMIITTVAVVLGRGIRLFGELDRDLAFRLVKTDALGEHLVKNHYVRDRSA